MRSFIMGMAGAAILTAMPLAAEARDRAYADSFGNLVIISGAGYKRIVVGQGSKAKEMSDFLDSGQPPEVVGDAGPAYVRPSYLRIETCYKPGTWVKQHYIRYGRTGPANLPEDCWEAPRDEWSQ